ncbi:MAG: 4-hydroxybutyrate--acetyl-CoA CoA transferase [Clostridiales bacterium]|jgi:acyl-CoA hydrolase|nr:4-hydroxybutyrate--acetyl-CoA CoA transferase [Clostridiales bacterium]
MYESKIIDIKQALALVKSNFHIVTGLGSCEGRDFMENLHSIAGDVRNVTITNCLPMSAGRFMDAEFKDSFNIDGWFYSPALRAAHKNGNISFVPNHLHLAGAKRLFHIKPNIYVGAASMPDRHGFMSLSLSNTYEKRMINAADIVILEINPNFPRTFGDVEIHYSQADYLVEADYAPPEIPDVATGEKDRIISEFITQYINDGDCLQLGIGGIPNAVAEGLAGKKDLGIHTEMLGSGLMKLAKLGVATGGRKNFYPGKIVATFVLGNAELYDFVHDNPSVLILDGNYVNDPAIIAKNDNQISINTTIEIDLTGQCCSESLGTVQFSGTGGQADTVIGAQKSKNGKSFIALHSTANVRGADGERHEVSKIVPTLKPGAIVSLSRNDVDFVVTEYGVAALRGTNVRERANRLIAIAHPNFREELTAQARELLYI